MELPPLMELSHELKLLGIEIGAGLSMEETVEKICRLR
jgi:hypothetical protein